MFEKLGGRKMIAATLTLAVGLGLCLLKDDIPHNMLYLLITIYGVFAGTNTINTIGGLTLGSKPQMETTVAPAPSVEAGIPIRDAVEAFGQLSAKVDVAAQTQAAMLEQIVKSTQLTQNALSMIAEKVLVK